MRTFLIAIMLVAAILTVPAQARQAPSTPPAPPVASAGEIPRLSPESDDAKPLTVYEWTAVSGATDERDGFRYTWRLPRDFTRSRSFDIVIVCHPNGADYRWGAANLKPEQFRPNNIVVCLEGTSEDDDGARVFQVDRRDAIEFRDFVLEMGRAFPIDRIFLYGHSEGALFVAFMASQFPGLTEGVTVNATVPWSEFNLTGGIKAIPIAFVHGSADPTTAYCNSIKARDSLRAEEHEMLLVRRMHGKDHAPNAARAAECIDWCAGMSTTQADTALAAAEALLQPRSAPEPDGECPIPFGGAYAILKRVTLETENHVEESDDAQKAKASELMKKIDAAGAKHVEILRKDLKSADDLVLGLGEDSGAWLGHLLALREDFRGVPSVEAFVKEINFDEAVDAQREAGQQILDNWYTARPEKQKFELVGNTLGECFLIDSLPSDLEAQMAALKAKAADLSLTEESIEKFGILETWTTAWNNGYKRYLNQCKQWK